MAINTLASNKTQNYGFPIYTYSDRPKFITDWNETMQELDTVIHTLSAGGEVNKTQIEQAFNRLEALSATLQQEIERGGTHATELAEHAAKLTDIQGDIGNIKDDLIEQNTLVKGNTVKIESITNAVNAIIQNLSSLVASVDSINGAVNKLIGIANSQPKLIYSKNFTASKIDLKLNDVPGFSNAIAGSFYKYEVCFGVEYVFSSTTASSPQAKMFFTDSGIFTPTFFGNTYNPATIRNTHVNQGKGVHISTSCNKKNNVPYLTSEILPGQYPTTVGDDPAITPVEGAIFIYKYEPVGSSLSFNPIDSILFDADSLSNISKI